MKIETVEQYRERMIQAFHNANCDELIALVVLPTEKEFQHLEWLLKKEYVPFLERANGVDAVQVIRCEDCKFYEVAELNYDGTPDKRCKPSICANGWYEYAVERDPNWFCADAEPKEKVNGK